MDWGLGLSTRNGYGAKGGSSNILTPVPIYGMYSVAVQPNTEMSFQGEYKQQKWERNKTGIQKEYQICS
jgi:hypothetical protein